MHYIYMHSTRVAAVCYLLRAGLTETVVKAWADWTSDQVRRYGRRLVLDPELVEPWPFYNPESGFYINAPTYAPPAKRRKSGDASPANVPCSHNPNPNLGSVAGAGTVKPRRGRLVGSGVGASGTAPGSGSVTRTRPWGRAKGAQAAR